MSDLVAVIAALYGSNPCACDVSRCAGESVVFGVQTASLEPRLLL